MLSEAKKGEIALKIVKRKLRRDGFKLSSSFQRELGSEAVAMNIHPTELSEFMESMVREILAETFPERH